MAKKKRKQNPLVNKIRATFSIEIELNRYLTEVSKETGYTRTSIVEELLRQHLYTISDCHRLNIDLDYSPILRALDYRKEMILKDK